ncbi:hypothetical protein [Pasteuria penetrans]|uniref:hypothetical protein n=1 Tax=Pasteuria penetrans TaxID=86005 RepID=UPI00165ADA49|nr:hypothetical protein [Pasteuria penetrans]
MIPSSDEGKNTRRNSKMSLDIQQKFLQQLKLQTITVCQGGALTKHYFKIHFPNRKKELENRSLEDAESRNGPMRIGMDDVSTHKGQRYFTTIHDQDSRAVLVVIEGGESKRSRRGSRGSLS